MIMAKKNLIQNGKTKIGECYVESYCGRAETDPLDLTADEQSYYRDKYSPYLEKLNNRKYSKQKTIHELYEEKHPAEEILWFYIDGKLPDRTEIIDISKEYVNWKTMWGYTHGDKVHVLDMQVLFDKPNEYSEPIPRCVIREIWDYVDENGILVIGQEKAMIEAGLDLPDPSKKEDRKNNRVMKWSKICRMKFLELLHDHGYEVQNKLLLTRNKSKRTGWWDE